MILLYYFFCDILCQILMILIEGQEVDYLNIYIYTFNVLPLLFYMARLKKFNVLKKAEKHNFFRLTLVIVCIIMPGKKMYQNIKSEEKNYIILYYTTIY